MKKSLVILIYFAFITNVFSQKLEWKRHSGNTYEYHSYTTYCEEDSQWWEGNGLTRCDDNRIIKMNAVSFPQRSYVLDVFYLAKDGTKWVGTQNNGLAHYDGWKWDFYNVENSGIPSNRIYCISEDKEGNIWLGTQGALVKFDRNEKWTVYDVNISGISHNSYDNIIFDDNGIFWGTGYFGLVKYDGVTWEVFNTENSDIPSRDNITSIEVDSKGNIWLGFEGDGVCRYDGVNWVNFRGYSELSSGTVTSLWIDSNDNVWAGTRYGLNKFDGVSWKRFGVLHSEWRRIYIHSLKGDNEGNIWLGLDSGLVRFNNEEFTDFTSSVSPIPDYKVEYISIDTNGNVWSMSSAQLTEFDGNYWKFYSDNNYNDKFNVGLPSGGVTDLIKDNNGNIWVGTGGRGAAIYDGKKWFIHKASQSNIPSNVINTITKDSLGNIWVGTDHGIGKYNGDNWETFNINNTDLPSNQIRKLSIDNNGILWCLTDKGLVKFDGTNWTTYNETNSGLIDNNSKTMTLDENGIVWIGYKTYLSKFNGNTWTHYTISGTSCTTCESIYALAIDKNKDIWVGTNYRLLRFDGTKWMEYSDSKAGLPGWVRTLHVDNDNTLWVGSSMKISSFDGEEWSYHLTNASLSFTSSIAFSDNGNIFVGTKGNGLFEIISSENSDILGFEKHFPKQDEYVVYPNPSNGLVNVYISKRTNIEILNTNGIIIFNDEKNKGEYFKYDFNTKKGLFYIRFTDNSQTYVTKVIIN